MPHCHRDFTVCSCSSLPVLLPGESSVLMCSTSADVSGGRAMRSALVKACRRIACCAHCGTGCSHAPRPGMLPAMSTVTAQWSFPIDTATTRSSSTANSRFRHPTHVRTGPAVLRCVLLVSGAEGSRWITAKSSVTRARSVPSPSAATGRAPTRGSHLVGADPPPVPAKPVPERLVPAHRRGCRCAIR